MTPVLLRSMRPLVEALPARGYTTVEDVTDLTGAHAERWLRVRRVRLGRLWPVHRLVPGRHRHHRGDRRARGGHGWRRAVMDMDTPFELLASQPFLAGLTPGQMDKLSLWSKRKVFHAGARLFEEGARADRFWLIREGHVTLETHVPGRGAVIVETLGPGAVLGWSWLFPPYRWHFSASAVETTMAIEFDGPGVRELCEEQHELGYQLMNRFLVVVVDRMQATRLRLLDLYAGKPA